MVKKITVKKNATFHVKLDENRTTGYTWDAHVTPGLTIIKDDFVRTDKLIGAGGLRVWTIKATDKGRQRFAAVYRRPSKEVSKNDRVYELKVKVK